jgi:hypothetical protein
VGRRLRPAWPGGTNDGHGGRGARLHHASRGEGEPSDRHDLLDGYLGQGGSYWVERGWVGPGHAGVLELPFPLLSVTGDLAIGLLASLGRA